METSSAQDMLSLQHLDTDYKFKANPRIPCQICRPSCFSLSETYGPTPISHVKSIASEALETPKMYEPTDQTPEYLLNDGFLNSRFAKDLWTNSRSICQTVTSQASHMQS